MPNPNLDKTNPDMEYIHQLTEIGSETDPARLGMTDEEYEAQKDKPGFDDLDAADRDMSDNLSDEATVLTYEETNINIPDNALEAARNRDNSDPHSQLYPDEFILHHGKEPATTMDMMDNFDAITDIEGGGVGSEFDQQLIGEDSDDDVDLKDER